MKLKSIEVENFRPYYGKQKVEFSQSDENITIIFGENGGGKTSLYRALMFCLFGDRHIEQDDTKEPVHLINRKALIEAESDRVTAEVVVKFEHYGSDYTIKRSIVGVLHGDQQIERDINVELVYTDEHGNTLPNPITDEMEVGYRIESIINDKMKNFFFFDGEQIDTLTTTKTSKRNAVKSAIANVTQVDALDKATSIFKSVERRIDETIRDSSKRHNLKKAIDQKEEVSKKLEDAHLSKYDIDDKIVKVDLDIEILEKKLSENESAKLLVEKIKLKKEELKSITKKYFDHSNTNLKILISESPLNLLEDESIVVDKVLQTRYESEKNSVPLPLINKSLLEQVCACCGLSLREHLDSLNYLNEMKESYVHSDLNEFISVILSHFKTIDVNGMKNMISTQMKKEFELRREIDNKQFEIEVENSELKKLLIDERELNDTRNNLNKERSNRDNLMIRKGIIEGELENLSHELNSLDNEIENLSSDEEQLKRIFEAKDIIKRIQRSLASVLQNYNSEMQKVLSDSTTHIFKSLISEKDRYLINEIRINDKYEIEIIDRSKKTFTQDISQGQRKIAAISFIMALTKIASDDTGNITFPFFMDTPFSNFDFENRKNLINNLPNLISQWILLLTDTEMSVNEEEEFKSTNKIGKWYRIQKIENYYAKIIEVPLTEKMVR